MIHMRRKSLDIPARLSDILTMAAKGQAKLHLELMGAKLPVLHHIQK